MNRSKLPPSYLAVIQTLFERFVQEGIPSVIVRGGEDLPVRLSGKDLDVFVKNRDLRKVEAILCDVARRQNLELVHFHKRSYFSAFWFCDRSEASARFLHIDLYPGAFSWKGFHYLMEDEVLHGASEKHGLPFPSDAISTLSLLLTSLLWGGFLKEKYLPRIRRLLDCPEVLGCVTDILHKRFGTKAAFLETLRERLPTKRETATFVSALRIGLIRQSLLRHPWTTLRQGVHFLWGELQAWLRPPGLVVAILGPDGSGKSLLLHNLCESVGPLFGSVESFHWRPGILPDIGVLLRRRKAARGAPVSNPHEKPPHGVVSSLLRLLYYLIDYWLGYFLKVWPGKARNRLIVFDRYASDMVADPRRYRLGLPQPVLRILCRLAPKPDLTVVLTALPEVLISRKQEVSKEELQEIIIRLRKMVASGPDSVWELDCARSPLEVATSLQHRIISTLRSRQMGNANPYV